MAPKIVDREERRLELAAAVEVFAEKGYAGTRIADVAERADVGKGTIYEYFRSKEELFLAVFDLVRRDLHARLDVELDRAAPAAERLRALVRSMVEQAVADVELYGLTFELMPGLLQSIQVDLASGLIFYVALILVVAFSILNTFLMAFLERTREFGVMVAIGTSPGRLGRLLLLESLFLTGLGIAVGVVLGSVVTLYFQAHGIDVSGANELLARLGISGKMYPRLSVVSALAGPLPVFGPADPVVASPARVYLWASWYF